eukprot:CAMPEP_0172664912 /NCGR_PEP_ID=MMETSP1074-20121228/6913_1 /TAXON_ID=2916 /ORGANISM="Ceratium fusus, Strain PA161109" /LENGTH=87 /DNA_ID=CAMNT_0013481149 /DNA_START=637 /DNA_END=900 /DNA_ORIENTATION=-
MATGRGCGKTCGTSSRALLDFDSRESVGKSSGAIGEDTTCTAPCATSSVPTGSTCGTSSRAMLDFDSRESVGKSSGAVGKDTTCTAP